MQFPRRLYQIQSRGTTAAIRSQVPVMTFLGKQLRPHRQKAHNGNFQIRYITVEIIADLPKRRQVQSATSSKAYLQG
ncbi:hypothetical protein BPOR_0825g00020 [Botrytis porri]|uniref:Uncharacterized protein n=1 Tax=Botrytis porri TaxID=87229 RepID=A0A4Z1KMK7_9HELO|nr:hypothetical protein BPOR_0825g00020 [Botrytis porri]